jgi:hypothetical protein
MPFATWMCLRAMKLQLYKRRECADTCKAKQSKSVWSGECRGPDPQPSHAVRAIRMGFDQRAVSLIRLLSRAR